MPGFTATALKVTGVPSQQGLVRVETLIDTGEVGRTDMMIAFEVSGLFVAQDKLEVRIQITVSELVK